MFLTKAYIRAFGNLEEKEIRFDSHLNSYREENGKGKTTLASFIRARFYGLDKQKSEERRRYLPYSNKDCGGSLSFTYRGNEYRIERRFGKKQSEDETHLFKNNREIQFTGEPGERFFNGFDKESFNRTIFLNPEDLSVSSTSTINEKLGSYTDGKEEGFSLDDVLKELEDYRKKFKPKKRGDEKGLIGETKKRISDYKDIRSSIPEIQEVLNRLYSDQKERNKEITELKDKKIQANKQNEAYQLYQQYYEKKNALKELADEFDKEKQIFPLGIPSDEEITTLKDQIRKKEQLERERNSSPLSDYEMASYDSLKRKFSSGIPTEEEIKAIEDSLNQIKRESDLDLIFTLDEQKLRNHFDAHPVDRDKIISEYQSYQQVIMNNSRNQKKPKSKVPLLLLIVGILILIIGVILGILIKPWLFSLAALSLAFFVPSVILHQKEKKQILKADSEINEKEKERRRLLNEPSSSIDEAYNKLKSDVDNYQNLKKKKEELQNRNEEVSHNNQEITDKATSFLRKYGYMNDYPATLLHSRKSDIKIFMRMSDIISNSNSAKKEKTNDYDTCHKNIDAALAKYQIKDRSTLDRDIADYKNAEKNYIAAKGSLSSFISTNNIDINSAENFTSKIDTSEIENELSDLNKALLGINQNIEEREQEIEEKQAKADAIPELQEKLDIYKHKEKIASRTQDYLKQAEENIKKRYIQPRHASFLCYSDKLEKLRGEKIQIDTNYNISIREKGETEDYLHLSSGQKALVVLCYRLALLDNIFKNDKPFLVRDDLFRYLDEIHLEEAKKLLKELSQERQVLYFTCHPSRNIH